MRLIITLFLSAIALAFSGDLLPLSAHAATPPNERAEQNTARDIDSMFRTLIDLERENTLQDAQFATRARPYDKRRARRRALPNRCRTFARGSLGQYGPGRFTHGRAYYGGRNVRTTRSRNGFAGGQRVRRRSCG